MRDVQQNRVEAFSSSVRSTSWAVLNILSHRLGVSPSEIHSILCIYSKEFQGVRRRIDADTGRLRRTIHDSRFISDVSRSTRPSYDVTLELKLFHRALAFSTVNERSANTSSQRRAQDLKMFGIV